MEGARGEGVALSKYAETHRLVIRELYGAISCMRRKGLVPKSTRKTRSKFVAGAERTSAGATFQTHRQVLCRIVCLFGTMMECIQWLPPS